MNYPFISIVIATFNSEKTLPLSLNSIRKQKYPKNKIEILVVDGGSTDSTRKIAKDYKCKLIDNPEREPVQAKHLAFLKAKGKYIIYLDSDEVLKSHKSISKKVEIFQENPKVKAVIPSGYKTPKGYNPINHYINEYGDPFSFFIYRLSKDSRFMIKQMKNRYGQVKENKNEVLFNLAHVKPLPIIELIAMGSMTDLEYLKLNFPQIKKDPSLIPFFFYYINKEPNLLAVAKKDQIIHYSADTFEKYLKKIKSRVKNNVFQTTMGAGGFLGRDKFQPPLSQLKKYLFLLYSLTLILPLLDSTYLSVTRKNIVYFVHIFLCLYTTLLIIYFYSLKVVGLKPKILSYGN